jgi:hypothetical protein
MSFLPAMSLTNKGWSRGRAEETLLIPRDFVTDWATLSWFRDSKGVKADTDAPPSAEVVGRWTTIFFLISVVIFNVRKSANDFV